MKYEYFEDKNNELVNKRINTIYERLDKKYIKIAKKFENYLQRKGLRIQSVRSYLQNLLLLSRELPDLLNPKKKDIDNYLLYLKNNYKPKTEKERRKFMYYFYPFILNKKPENINFLKDIKISSTNSNKLPEDLLDPSEIKYLVQNCDNFRDKAILMLLYETGARKGEFLKLRIRHIEIKESNNKKFGFITIPMGKTTSRKVPIIFSLPHIINWINSHPHREDIDSPLFVRNDKNNKIALNEDSLKGMMRRLKAKIGFKKKLYPHLFRHSRMTELAKELTEQELKKFAGWTPGSNMASVYVHLAGEDVSNKILANAGLIDHKIANKGKSELLSVECPSCNTLNGSDVKICKCGRVLDLKEAQKEIDGFKEQTNEVKTLKSELDSIKEMIKQMAIKGDFNHLKPQ